MSKNKDIENILDECLERMLLDGESVEQCLDSYPEHADELRPLLDTVMDARVISSIQPGTEFRDRARRQLQANFREIEEKQSKSIFAWNWQPRWATAAVTIALVLLLSGGGTVAAAAGSMPGDTLYPVKLATEQTRLAFTFSELGKAEVYTELADKRVDEIIYLAGVNKPDQIETTSERLNGHLDAIITLSLPDKEGWTEEDEGQMLFTEAVAEEAIVAEKDMEEEETEAVPGLTSVTGEAAATAEEVSPGVEASPGIKQQEGKVVTPAPEKVVTAEESAALSKAAVSSKESLEVSRALVGTGANLTTDRQNQLKITVYNQASTNTERLRAALEEAPESSRPALEEAINTLESGYQKAINSLNTNLK